jgi:WD40-like Beta Propeller Repeat
MNARRLTLATLASLCALAGAFALSAVPAQAAFTYRFERQLTPPGGKFRLVYNDSVAVNDFNGNTYVGNSFGGASGSGVVDVFETSTGTELATPLDGSTTPAGSFGGVVRVAATNATGMVYVLDEAHKVVDVFDSTGKYHCQITGAVIPSATECNSPGGSATPTGGFSQPESIAVDQASHDVYVLDLKNSAVDVFSAGGEYLRQISLSSVPGGLRAEVGDVAVDDFNGHVYVRSMNATTLSLELYEFDAAGGYVTAWTGGVCQPGSSAGEPGSSACSTPAGTLNSSYSVAIDNANGRVYVTLAEGGGRTDVFASSGEYLTQVNYSFNNALGTAVDQATHKVYVSDEGKGLFEESKGVVDVFGLFVVPDVRTGSPSEPKLGSITLNGTVDPDAIALSDCHFDYGTTTSYGQVAPCVPAAGSIPVDSSEHAVSAHITGLPPDAAYHFRLEATNANGTEVGRDLQFRSMGAGVHSESVSNVASTSATLEASIDPNRAHTTYYFQYGPSVGYGEDAPLLTPSEPGGALVGSGEGDVQLSQHVHVGLSAGTVYHYRVVAVSELEVSSGVFKAEEFDGPDQTFTTQSAGGTFALPDGRAWEMVSPPDKHGAHLTTNFQGEHALQAAAAGNAMTYLATAPTESQPLGFQNEMQVLSTRGPEGWSSRDIEIPHIVSTDPNIGHGQEYKFFSSDLSLGALQPPGGFNPSVSVEASEQTPFLRSDYVGGNVNEQCVEACYRPLVTGKAGYANVPEGTVFGPEGKCPGAFECGPIFEGSTPDMSHVVLSSTVPLTEKAGVGSLYEWSAGKLQLVSVLPASEGGAAEAGSLGNQRAGEILADTISQDGSRVIWTSGGGGSNNHLYMRDTVKGETFRLDEGLAGAPFFEAANRDASEVFFSDGGELYEYSVGHGAPLPLNNGAGASSVLGISEDGSWVYFMDPGSQLVVRHDGTTRQVAVLSADDLPEHGITGLPVRVSPNGRWLAFMSSRSLTGYDNRDAFSGRPDEEVYLYHAEAEGPGTQGRLVCASCDPTGARPVGEILEPNEEGEYILGGNRAWGNEHVALAANIPGWTLPLYQSRYLSNSGRLFFNTKDALVPQDINGTWDVYQYEPPGVGDCGPSSAGFSERSGGCVGLISSGAAADSSGFLDASETGGDVFFLTTAKLLSQDVDTSMDVYDAHECTTASPCVPAAAAVPPPCSTGDSCKPAPSPQPTLFGASGSATFSGAGNVVPPGATPGLKPKSLTRAQRLAQAVRACHRKRAKARAVCVRRARARYAASKSSRANASGKGRG